MFERLHHKSAAAAVVAVLAALGVAGVAGAQSGGTTQSKAPAATPAQEVPGQESNAPENSATDPDNLQQGDQTTPDTRGASTAGEQPGAESSEAAGSETAPNNDGPGGHADEPGNANADHQAQGVE